ncbi:expressed unknown protein [Ectocarpus siliculosus]|uniref:Uncharacterized protein n=1 Tax=Ectocarpus siliculosus TaxID=2880 RepID=D8LMY8_ECTSI|nr:expressed unknown protein [Ectocarpus siliculosus]|eukprot:CBN74789.1 expressed unknown protein [Ectocarpus siliculosus]
MHGKKLSYSFVGTELTDKTATHLPNRWFAYVLGKIARMGGATTPSGERTPAS